MAKKKARKPNAEYTLKKSKYPECTKRMLALDPGKTNMGIALVGCLPSKELVVVANSIMTRPVSELAANFRTGLDAYLSEIDRWVRLYKPHGIIAERFMTRGGMGTTIEVVGIMIGAIAAKYDIPIKVISAATWKNAFRRRFTEQDNLELKEYYRVCGTTSHQLDAVLIGCYGMEAGLGTQLNYTPKSIIKSAEKSSRIRLTNRKLKIEDL